VKARVGDLFQIFGFIDAAFSSLMTIDPSDVELAASEISMNVLIKTWRNQGLGMTLKARVCEHHVVRVNHQFRGIGDKDELFIEQLHQVGKRDVTRMASVPSFEKRQHSIMVFSAIVNHDQVLNIIAEIELKSKREFKTDRSRFKSEKSKTKEDRAVKREAFVNQEAVLDLSNIYDGDAKDDDDPLPEATDGTD
jgi:hypothetical protein